MSSYAHREFSITPYKLCVSIFITEYGKNRSELSPRQNGRMCLFVLDLIRQSEYHFKQLTDFIDSNCSDCPIIKDHFKETINRLIDDDNYLFELVKKLRECINAPDDRDMSIDKSSVAGLYLRKVYIYFDKMTHQTCMKLFDELMTYLVAAHNQHTFISPKRRGKQANNASFASPDLSYLSAFEPQISIQKTSSSIVFQTPGRKTRSSQRSNVSKIRSQARSQFASQELTTVALFSSQPEPSAKNDGDINQSSDQPTQMDYLIHQQMGFLKANELRALTPRELHESLKRPATSKRSDATFLRYLNILRVNEFVASKQLLMAYFDMVSDTVSRSYSSLNYAIWYIHHGHYRRAIECLQECFCCAQAADDEKCLLISLMWLARTVIQARQKNSSKYSVVALLKHVERRSFEVGMIYVQAMASMTLEQITGPKNDNEQLKKSHETLKQASVSSRQQNLFLGNSAQPNPLDKDDCLPSAEILAVRNSMNDVLSMHYALVSAHFNLMDCPQSSTLMSQTLLHFDLIEKCGNEDVLLVNENTFIAIRNLAYHVWNMTRDFMLACEMLVDLCSRRIAAQRTDHHTIWRQALAEISFESYLEQGNWKEASKIISYIKLTDIDGAQLRKSELLEELGCNQEAQNTVNNLISRLTEEENNLQDLIELDLVQSDCTEKETCEFQSISERHEKLFNCATGAFEQDFDLCPTSSLSIEHKAFIKSKALLLSAKILDEITSIFQCLSYATKNKFNHNRTASLKLLAKHLHGMNQCKTMRKIMEHILIEIFANGTKAEKEEARSLMKFSNESNIINDNEDN